LILRYFTYYLLEGLNGNPDAVDSDGYVTPSSLGGYVYEQLLNLPNNNRPKQRPIIKAAVAGDIILVYYPELAKYIKLEITPELNNCFFHKRR
jgi:hypothetical protein